MNERKILADVYQQIYEFKHPLIKELASSGLPTPHLTERAIELFKQGDSGQGYAGLYDLETGEIDLIPAYNKDDGRERKEFYYQGKEYHVESPEPLGKNTGVVHTKSLTLIKKNHKQGIILGFGVFKGKEEQELRNRSASQNTLAIKYNDHYLMYVYANYYANEGFERYKQLVRSIPGDITENNISPLILNLARLAIEEDKEKVSSITVDVHAQNSQYEIDFLRQPLSGTRKELEKFLFEEGKTRKFLPLYKAVLSGNTEEAIFLKDYMKKYYPEKLSNLLIDAVKNNQLEVVDFLLKNGCNPNEKNKDGLSLLQIATIMDNGLMVEKLIEYGSNPHDLTLIQIALALKKLNSFEAIVKHIPNIEGDEGKNILKKILETKESSYRDFADILIKKNITVEINSFKDIKSLIFHEKNLDLSHVIKSQDSQTQGQIKAYFTLLNLIKTEKKFNFGQDHSDTIIAAKVLRKVVLGELDSSHLMQYKQTIDENQRLQTIYKDLVSEKLVPDFSAAQMLSERNDPK